MSAVNQLRVYWNFIFGLKSFLKDPINAEQSWQITRDRLENRQQNLLNVVKSSIYANPDSPYLKLLEMTGCEYGDFCGLVRSDGIEHTLYKLSQAGVFVSIEEFKGKQPVIRGSNTFYFNESDFNNPYQTGHLGAGTGASRGAAIRTIYDFKNLADKWAVHQIMRFDAYGVLGLPVAMWLPIMPGAGPVALLAYAKSGIIPLKWFSPIEKRG